MMQMIYNEIEFLRELSFCENIINLDSVYKSQDKIQLVMKFAEYGSLRNFIVKTKAIKETDIR